MEGSIDGPRGCSEHELAQVVDVGNIVMRITAGQPANWGHSWPHVYCASNMDNVRLIFDGGSSRAGVSQLGIYDLFPILLPPKITSFLKFIQ